jgi:hypothetical protein
MYHRQWSLGLDHNISAHCVALALFLGLSPSLLPGGDDGHT